MINEIEYRKWLLSEIGYETSYHNHKETMAWVITALYIPSIIYIGYTESMVWRGICWERVIVTLITLAGCLVFKFVNMQYRHRWEAADIIKILMRKVAELNNGNEPPQQEEWKIDKKDDCWPNFVQYEINKRKEKREIWKYIWKTRQLRCLCEFVIDDRGKTEIVSYTAIIISSICSILLAWA